MSNDSTKQRYQLFRKVEKISFDDIRDNIESMATPCSEVFELTYDQYKTFRQAMRSDPHFDDVEIRSLNTWFTTDEIMATIQTEVVRAENELRRLLAAAARRAQQEQAKTAKKAKFKTQCEGKNGKVK